MPAILVGGGSILIERDLAGVSTLSVPEHSAVANAIGAAIAQVGGEVDRVFSYEQEGRENAIAQAKDEAQAKAVDAGAEPASIEIIEVEEIPSCLPAGRRLPGPGQGGGRSRGRLSGSQAGAIAKTCQR